MGQIDIQTIAVVAALGLLALSAYRRFSRPRRAPLPQAFSVLSQSEPAFDPVAGFRKFELQVQEERRLDAIKTKVFELLNPNP